MADTLLNMKAFLATARTGSFSEAARQLGVAPSVITKRVNQLERAMGARLFERSTRRVALTAAGERQLPRVQGAVSEIEDVLAGIPRSADALEGSIRVKAPTTLTTRSLGRVFGRFQQEHPNVSVDLVLIDRSVNPAEEGFDIAIGALPASYGGVVDEALCPYPRLACASPAYLERRGTPGHPRDLAEHECLTFSPAGSTWPFESDNGPTVVHVRSRLTTNDSLIMLDAALSGSGIAVLPTFLAAPAIESGALRHVMADFRVPLIWLKALVPANRRQVKRVQALLDALREEFSPTPPWDRHEAAA